MDQYNEAIRYNDSNADNYFNRGNVYQQQREFELAHEDFEAAMQREDRNAKYYHGRGLCYQEEAELEKAKGEQCNKDLENNKISMAIEYF